MKRAIEPMKNKNHDELDADHSHFAAPDFARIRPISKSSLFADISERVENLVRRYPA